MKNIRLFSENSQFLVVKFSIYLNRRIFVMDLESSLGAYVRRYVLLHCDSFDYVFL